MKKRPPNIDEGSRPETISQPILRTKTRKTAIAVKRHTQPGGSVDVLDTPPMTPFRTWFGVPHAEGDILYVRGDNIDAVNEWLVAKGLATGDIEGEPAIAAAGIVLDYVGDVLLEQSEFSEQSQTQPPIFMGGFHVNVRIL